MPQTDRSKLHGGLPPQTDIHIPPASTEDQVLSRLNKNYRLSKAQQILRLLKDQDALNQRFRECDLLDEDEDNVKNKEKSQQDAENEDAWSLQEEQQSEAGDSDLSENEAERRAAKIVSLRKHRNSVDPGRCKTSMGFYNQAEVTEIPYDTDSDNVAGLDSAGSTPRGRDAAGATTTAALQPAVAKQTLIGQGNPSPCGNSSRTKISHPNKGNNSEVTVKELTISEADRLVQSARSSRPKTSLTSSSSTRSRYYRQQPHPECQHNLKAHHGNQQPHSPVELHHRFPQPRGSGIPGDTRQSIISRLEPHHPMAVKPFCETRASQEEATRAGVQNASQISTSKNNLRHHQQQSGGNNTTTPHHFSPATAAAVALYDMAPVFSKDAPVRSVTRRGVTGPTAGSSHHHGANPNRSTSFLEHQRMLPGRAPRLSVDSSPLQLGEVSPRGRGVVLNDDPANRRGAARLTRVKKRVGEMARGSVPSPMHVLTERAHPSVTVMKLPPLETAVSKGGGAAGRDLVCVGKD